MDKSQLDDLYSMLPAIKPATIYERKSTGTYDPAQPIAVSASEKRPIDVADNTLFDGVSGDIEKCVWHVWVSTMTGSWDANFSAKSQVIGNKWLLKDSEGTEWVVLNARLEMMETRWRLTCVEYIGDPIISS